MTGNQTPPAAGPPWPLELLADLHAGVFDDETAVELRARIAADPEGSATLATLAIFAALDATRADLAALPPLGMPDGVASRIDAALRAEAAPRGAGPDVAAGPPISGLAEARERRSRRSRGGGRGSRGLIAGAGLLAAAAATVGIVAVAGLTGGQTTGTPRAAPTNASDQPLPSLSVSRNDLGSALGDALAVNDYGPLADGGRLRACLAANRLDPATTKPLGAREVDLDGKPGVLLILPTGTIVQYRLLVVAPDCGLNNPAVLAETTVGR